MGEMIKQNIKNRIFNSPLEIALRVLLILSFGKKNSFSLERLIIYDYLILNSGDIENAPESLHPSLPNRSSQLLVKRELLQKALLILASKELIVIKYAKPGIQYAPSKLTEPFVSYFESQYYENLKERIIWVAEAFKSRNDKSLEKFISLNLEKWGSEFLNESYMREELNYE